MGNDVFKARLVINSYAQTEGIDDDEKFSPVFHSQYVRFLISIAAHQGLKLDIKIAFYMEHSLRKFL